ncbi:MAG: alpha/beta hydrolase [Mogibacterium diversum]|uniref:alpha/beta fold hydrolase n=1 Tax=Mogibacterium diversum TaxID=114527 RepID=UPI001CAB8708|nr:alpha/beta hydrolase [Mogibacterium diversum]MBF1340551.1 alpha/beta hydrolase [Mogibacterium diversum]
MEALDLNSENKRTVLFIHPMLSSAEGMKVQLADNLGSDLRYIIPDLSAHGKSIDKTYHTSKEEAEEIYKYLKSHEIKELELAYGASLGGVILLQLLRYKDLKIKKVIFEGCSLWQNSWIQEFFIKKVFIKKHRKAVENRELAVKKMTKLYGEKALVMADTFIAMNEESILNIIHDCAFVELPVLTEAEQRKCLFTYGSKEFDLKSAKKFLPKNYPQANLKLWDGYGHCTKITRDNAAYCDFIRKEIDS